MKKQLISFIFFAALSFHGYALQIGPLVHEVTTGNQGNRTKITLSNNSASKQFIDANISRLVFDGGSYEFLPAPDNELLVFPPAFRLEPGATQNVTVIWSGPSQLPESRSYSVKFTAINGSQVSGKDAIGIEINYNVIIHVSSALQAASIAQVPIPVSKTATGLRFAVENRGNKYSKLSNFDITLRNSSTSQDHLMPSRSIVSEGLDTFIPANQTVEMTIPFTSLPALDIDQVILVEKAP